MTFSNPTERSNKNGETAQDTRPPMTIAGKTGTTRRFARTETKGTSPKV